jgi:hypothetical protein
VREREREREPNRPWFVSIRPQRKVRVLDGEGGGDVHWTHAPTYWSPKVVAAGVSSIIIGTSSVPLGRTGKKNWRASRARY